MYDDEDYRYDEEQARRLRDMLVTLGWCAALIAAAVAYLVIFGAP